jgi:hypothetical protein
LLLQLSQPLPESLGLLILSECTRTSFVHFRSHQEGESELVSAKQAHGNVVEKKFAETLLQLVASGMWLALTGLVLLQLQALFE